LPQWMDLPVIVSGRRLPTRIHRLVSSSSSCRATNSSSDVERLASCHCRDLFPTKTRCSKNGHGGTSADLSEALAFWRAGPDRWLEEVLTLTDKRRPASCGGPLCSSSCSTSFPRNTFRRARASHCAGRAAVSFGG
jgi:hypothetical protein